MPMFEKDHAASGRPAAPRTTLTRVAARKAGETESPTAIRRAAFLVLDAVGSEAERCRTSGPRAAAAGLILGVDGG